MQRWEPKTCDARSIAATQLRIWNSTKVVCASCISKKQLKSSARHQGGKRKSRKKERSTRELVFERWCAGLYARKQQTYRSARSRTFHSTSFCILFSIETSLLAWFPLLISGSFKFIPREQPNVSPFEWELRCAVRFALVAPRSRAKFMFVCIIKRSCRNKRRGQKRKEILHGFSARARRYECLPSGIYEGRNFSTKALFFE